MKAKRLTRVAIPLAGSAALIFGMQGTALAAQTVNVPSGGGYGQWQADPSGSIPGDSIRACDTGSDGDYVRVDLDVNRNGSIDRTAWTKGHPAPSCSAWISGNLAEGTPVTIWVMRVDSGGTILLPEGEGNFTA
ncbi:hypothetical protein GT204_15915 [Streptomyces sp. SID4919]|uniref:hypothetical protein n=1 Tax=unclassified Streptomyces TaxID=2593676 RepID=UPI000823DF66|nr:MULTISPECIES: hypothetical protein [unclassified Streptomyces]MYY10350.1 hypothetical protein [Streptomyces sp. SID4919]SCK63374.1 hypothetical protein YW7DRAFT_07128 [Streptomyces sp. AmelKG-E11A]